MYARHCAWLNVTPKEEERARRDKYTDESPQKQMMELSAYEAHLLRLWFECGTVSQGEGGLLPLEWSQIESWARQFYSETYIEWVEHPRQSNRHKLIHTPIPIQQCTLLDSELKLIRKLSQEYANEYSLSEDPLRPCPKEIYVEDVTEDAALANADAMLEGFRQVFVFGKQENKVEVVQNK